MTSSRPLAPPRGPTNDAGRLYTSGRSSLRRKVTASTDGLREGGRGGGLCERWDWERGRWADVGGGCQAEDCCDERCGEDILNVTCCNRQCVRSCGLLRLCGLWLLTLSARLQRWWVEDVGEIDRGPLCARFKYPGWSRAPPPGPRAGVIPPSSLLTDCCDISLLL